MKANVTQPSCPPGKKEGGSSTVGEDLAAPFSHALHLFRPDPQRSICIGKRNSEQLARVLERVLGEGPDEGAGRGSRARVLAKVLGESPGDGRGRGSWTRVGELASPGWPEWAAEAWSRRKAPLLTLPRPAGLPLLCEAETLGQGTQQPLSHVVTGRAEPRTPFPPPHLRDWGTKTFSECIAEPGRRAGGRAARPTGPRGCWPGTWGRASPGQYLSAKELLLASGPGKRTALPSPSLPAQGLTVHTPSPRLPRPWAPSSRGSGGSALPGPHTPDVCSALLLSPRGVTGEGRALQWWGWVGGARMQTQARDMAQGTADQGQRHVHLLTPQGPRGGHGTIGSPREQVGTRRVSVSDPGCHICPSPQSASSVHRVGDTRPCGCSCPPTWAGADWGHTPTWQELNCPALRSLARGHLPRRGVMCVSVCVHVSRRVSVRAQQPPGSPRL